MDALGSSVKTLVVDASALLGCRYALRDSGEFVITLDGDTFRLSPQTPVQGWLRRLAPADWQRGVILESEDAVVRSACLSVIAAIAQTANVRWLSGLDAALAAENKMVQYSTASRLGIPVARAVVTSDPAELPALGDELVVKPLGPGHFYSGDEARVVFTTPLSRDEAARLPLDTAPFILQTRLAAVRHHRVVTVRDEVWSAAIDASTLPVDWRTVPAAHRGFAASRLPSDVVTQALKITGSLALGYSSQDWIETGDGFVFVDLNPAGQWLFLPDPPAGHITSAIARHLLERP